MVSPVAFLSVTPEINEIVDILMSNSHGAYPIVDNSDGGALYRGTVTRLHLISILEHLQDTGFASVETAKVTKRGGGECERDGAEIPAAPIAAREFRDTFKIWRYFLHDL